MKTPGPHVTALWLNRDAAVATGGSEPAAPQMLLLPLEAEPVPFTLTEQAEAALDDGPEPEAEL